MWTPTTREQHSRSELRYSTDLTDAEWTVIEPLLPAACPHGRPRLRSMREIVNGIFYVLRGGIAWRLLPPLTTPPSFAWRGPWPASPKDLPPKGTVYGYLSAWRDIGLFVSEAAFARLLCSLLPEFPCFRANPDHREGCDSVVASVRGRGTRALVVARPPEPDDRPGATSHAAP